jgi:hypothetical protein
MHIKLTNGIGTLYSISQLYRDNPQVSFPQEIPDATLAEFGVYPLRATTQSTYNTATERVEEGTPVQQDGEWVQVWNVVSLTAEETQQRNDAKADSIRNERGELLVASDWTQVDDSPLTNIKKAEWASYRQALRDVTAQTGFPWTVTWPDAP